ncbi:hypothetical protein RB595_007147 [Gaeumannomyces hyphopodioides]
MATPDASAQGANPSSPPPARISPDCPDETAQILRAAAAHDVAQLKKLLDSPGKASAQDPTTRETPLHAAIRSAAASSDDAETTATATEAAKATLTELFWSGAIWNDVDDGDETPGCLALRLGLPELYGMCRDAGVRAEMLFGVLGGYEALSSGDEDEAMAEDEGEGAATTIDPLEDGDEAPQLVDVDAKGEEAADPTAAPDSEEEAKATATTSGDADPGAQQKQDEHTVESETYLRSKLTYSDGKLVDDNGNGVMMAWETDIMRRSVHALLSPTTATAPTPDSSAAPLPSGKRILNIGFGMGIVDSMFAATNPSRHHVVEAHPEVLAHATTSPDSAFGASWEARGPEPGAYKIFGGRWQDVCRGLLEAGEVYDAIYFDTFGEDYSQLRLFFTDLVPGLLDQHGRFGFFNGLGADRQVCYDVYTRVVDMHLSEAGMDVDWTPVDVDMDRMREAGAGEWEGVKRRYWTLDKYQLPVCTFLG